MGGHDAVLVGDIGGTRARLAVATAQGLQHVEILANDDHDDLPSLLTAWRDRHGVIADAAALAVAAPVTGDRVSFTNRGWSFSAAKLKRDLGLARLRVLNDFEAVAWCLPALGQADVVHLGGPTQGAHDAPRLALGPGTGLGLASLVPTDTGFRAIATEGGHVALAATDELERALLDHIGGGGRVRAEDVLCGAGFVRLLHAWCAVRGLPDFDATPEDVTTAALAGSGIHRDVVRTYVRLLARYAGDAALMHGARGGVYLVQGIAQTLAPFLAEPAFREAFEAKGAMTDWVRQVPTWWVREDLPALRGAARSLGVTVPARR